MRTEAIACPFNDSNFTIRATVDLTDHDGVILNTLESHTFQMGVEPTPTEIICYALTPQVALRREQ